MSASFEEGRFCLFQAKDVGPDAWKDALEIATLFDESCDFDESVIRQRMQFEKMLLGQRQSFLSFIANPLKSIWRRIVGK